MRWWKKFWKLRKQNDVIKIMLLYFAIGTGFIVNAVYNSVLLYQMAQSPAEYIITGESGGNIPDSKLKEVHDSEDIDDVTAISRQIDSAVTLQYKANETAFTCTVLSKEYIEAAYGIKESGAMKTFYVNQSAYKQLKEGLDNTQSLERGVENNSLLVSYIMESETATDANSQSSNTMASTGKRTARVVLIENSIWDSPYMFCSGSVSPKDATSVRICAKQNDGNATKLQNLGFTIENAEMMQEAEYAWNIRADRIGHSLITALICLFCIAAVWKYGYARQQPLIY